MAGSSGSGLPVWEEGVKMAAEWENPGLASALNTARELSNHPKYPQKSTQRLAGQTPQLKGEKKPH